MIERYRRKIILISMAVLSVTMLLLAGVIDLVSWTATRSEIVETVDLLTSGTQSGWRGNEHGRKQQHDRRTSSYAESRWFLVVSEHGSLSAELSNITSYTEEEALAMAQSVLDGARDEGFLQDCYFRRTQTDERASVLFLDCSARLTMVETLIRVSLIVCAAGILLAGGLITLFSRRAIRPLL